MAVENRIIDEIEIRKAIQQFHPDGELFEARIIPKDKRKPASGYFKDAETLIEAFKKFDLRGANIYMTIQQIDDALFSRQQSEHFVSGANSTNDNEVIGYKWLFVDLDPVRPTGISSTDEELKKAFELAKKVLVYMEGLGFEKPIKGISGNGAHLQYRINIRNTRENKELIEKCLKALSMLFDTEAVQIDTTNFNPSRVCKLYGSLAQKGSNTKERPHRMSHLITELTDAKVTDRTYLEKLAAVLPEEPAQNPTKYNNYGAQQFDIREWMSRYGLKYREASYKDGTKFVLDECPFDSSHKAPDSMITLSSSGAVGFKCLHNSCSEYHWKDLRLKFEPDAYEYNDTDRRIEDGWAKHNKEKTEKAEALAVKEEEIPTFETASMILNREEPDPEYIKTGIIKIDKKLNGLEKGKISVISGLRASAKSTLLSEIMLNAVESNNVVVAYSGELSDKSFLNWMTRQAAGKTKVEKSAKYENFYYVRHEDQEKIATWLGERFWLYNNTKRLQLKEFLEGMEQKCNAVHADLMIIDNMMALDVASQNRTNEFDAQTRFMWALKGIAQRTNTHVILVAHPRKANGFLRLDDIAGSGNIGNIIDNCFIVHRNNNDFQRLSKDMFGWKDDYWLFTNGCTNVVEIAKDREHGTCDEFIDLYFEPETKRLKNYKAENVLYGWDEWIYPAEDIWEDVK